jgi:hypothetical protein
MRSMEDDAEAQKLGVVGIPYLVDTTLQHTDLQILQKTGKLRNALPVRFKSVHVCYSDPRMLPIVSSIMFIVGKHTRVRFRAHYGSNEECQSRMSSFGIPISALPVSSRGEFNLENHRTFIAKQRAIEAKRSKGEGPLGVAQRPKDKAAVRQPITKEDVFVAAPQPNQPKNNEPSGYGGVLMGFSNNFGVLPLPTFAMQWWSAGGTPILPQVLPPHRQLPVYPPSHVTGPTSASLQPAKFSKSPASPYVIYDPLPNDIFLGRGKPIQERPANVRFREMLEKHMDKYEQDEKGAKVKVVAYITHLVKEEGGRFLKELEGGGWVEVDEATARAKVSHAFRTRRAMFHSTLEKDKSKA